MKNKILQEFLNSDIRIKSQEKLEQYIDYCIENDTKKRLLNEHGYSRVSHHHILPKSLFPQYKDIKINYKWNGTHLLYSNHYYTHWLLTEAIDNYGMLSAFCAMHGTDLKNGRIIEQDLIPKDEFQKKMEEKGKKHIEWGNTEIILDNGTMSTNSKENGKKISNTRNDKNWKETTGNKAKEKMIKTRRMKDSDGLDSYDKMIIKVNNNRDENGLTSLQRGGISTKKVMSKIDENGFNGYQKAGKTLSKNLSKTAKRFNVFDKNNKMIFGNLLGKEVRKISQNLPFCTIQKPLGSNPQSAKRYINNNKEHLIGLYSIEIKKD